MNKKDLQLIIEQNSLNELTDQTQLANVDTLIKPLTYQTYPNTLLYNISDVQPLFAPTGQINAVIAHHNGNDSSAKYQNTRILKITGLDTTGIVAGTLITGSEAGAGVVLYIDDRYVQVKLVSLATNFVVNEAVNGIRIEGVYSSKAFTKNLLSNYSTSTDNEISLSFVNKQITAETRKLKSKISIEAVRDVFTAHGESAKDIIASVMASQIRTEMDKEVIDYIKSIATPVSDLVLSDSRSDISKYIFQDITYRILRCLSDISTATLRPMKGYAIVSPKIAAVITPELSYLNQDESNEVYIGNFGNVKIFQDYNANEDTVIVGYKSDVREDAGLIFAPYNQTLIIKTDVQGDPILYLYNRYGFSVNPQDDSLSEFSNFFQMFNVDFSRITNYGYLTDEAQFNNDDYRQYEQHYVGDGVVNTFDIEHKNVTNIEIYVAGLFMTKGADYFIENNRVVFNTPPYLDSNVTIKYEFLLVDSDYVPFVEYLTGDGIRVSFDLTEKQIINIQVYVNGIFMSDKKDYVYNSVTNTVDFLEPPLNGATISIIYAYYKELSYKLDNYKPFTQIEVSDGIKTVYTLNYTDIVMLKVFMNGILLRQNQDFTYDAVTRTITLFEIYNPNDNINFHYMFL